MPMTRRAEQQGLARPDGAPIAATASAAAAMENSCHRLPNTKGRSQPSYVGRGVGQAPVEHLPGRGVNHQTLVPIRPAA